MSGFEIGTVLENTLKKRFKKGSVLLELGSGEGTQRLSEHFEMMSVESEKEFVDKYDSIYIHAPIDKRTNWFTIEPLKYLGFNYDAILIDAPRAIPEDARLGFLDNMDLFNLEVPIFVDDTHRPSEHKLAVELSKRLKRPMTKFEDEGKSFIII